MQNVRISDSTTYYCHVWNKIGEDEAGGQLFVRGLICSACFVISRMLVWMHNCSKCDSFSIFDNCGIYLAVVNVMVIVYLITVAYI